MKRVRKLFSAEEALALFQNIAEGESDGGEISDFEADWSEEDTDSDYEPHPSSAAPTRKRPAPPRSTASETGRRQAQNTRETQREDAPASHSAAAQGPGERGKDGTVWEPVPPQTVRRGRHPSQNILRETAGPTLYARQAVTDKESALLCLLDATILEHIRDCTVAQARLAGAHAWELSIGELKTFIALLYVRGAFSKNIEMESLWSGEWGLPFFQSTMPRSRYRDIMRYVRFDRREERMARLSTDKFTLATDVWQWFVANSICCYRPSDNLTVDEQLFPTKARCRFTQFMANKPDKFGIKFWVVAEVTTNTS
ncbi:hypothetical protein WMY93_022838 [Mugilogobius chulae]|uniref:PiggyBac transposable element-derived protein domain-containing protein n=1 Tax=Mugilogobius chulae TaxID=88201 RepID=A0AAW0N823_9GOBI